MVVLVGSSAESRTHKNPLSFEERKALLLELFPKAVVLPLPDMPSNDDWVKLFESTIALGVGSLRLSGDVQARLYSADATRADDYALRCAWVKNLGHSVVPVTPVKATTDLSATLVRDRWFTGQYGDLTSLVPAPTLALLKGLDIGWMRSHYVKQVPAGELGAVNSVFVAFVAEPSHLYRGDTRCSTWGEDIVNTKLGALGYVTRWNGELGFAGGPVHPTESLTQALVRQCRHEIGHEPDLARTRMVASHAMIGNKQDDQHTHLYVCETNINELYGIRRRAVDASQARTDVSGFCVTHLTADAPDVLLSQKWAGTGLDSFKALLYGGLLPKPVVGT